MRRDVQFVANFSEIEPKPHAKSNAGQLNEGLKEARKIRFAESDEDLETILASLFRAADADGNGSLDANEIEKMLNAAGVELTDAELDPLRGVELPVDGEGDDSDDD